MGIESCQVRETRLLNRQFDLDTELLWTLLGREGRLELVSAQRTWLGYERQECEGLRHAFFGGPIAPVIAGACVITLTQARDQELAQEVSDTIHADCKGVARGGLYRHCPSSSGSHVGIGKG